MAATVHARYPESRSEGSFEVIVGKVLKAGGDPMCFGFVPHVDAQPKRRPFEALKSQGLRRNQRAEFLTDGGDTVRERPLSLGPDSEHWRDWFHITMRLTVMGQMTRGLAAEEVPASEPGEDTETRPEGAEPETPLERLRWHLWHGKVYRALQITENLGGDLESRDEPSERSKKLLKAVREFHPYIESDRSSIPN